ncbi:radical SAM/SPASM domain-containing protein [Chitinophaga nivalis]|uniref:SPASM domain-containing protein n=1 Tax=Chitinophaga nivalis TaxID=2991709 RepID=A0ABT3IPC9_9BACT|nr:radical SAM protein [Chitinophaga nivalis]MCW3464502.1 SPASM domain-containing protein [Chitinophaga nivalis]MCW3485807.1 SPASM domain-containing protein [Chitinophaga nivalis]
MLKPNPYNVLMYVDEYDEFLLFNTLSGGMMVLNKQEGIILSELMTLNHFSATDCQGIEHLYDYLTEKEYLLNREVDIISLLDKHTASNQFRDTGTIYLTIGTTITCNMGCAYCFEFVKPNHTLKDEKVKRQIGVYIEQIITKSGKDIHTLDITWYGGEPLINVAAIVTLSKDLLQLSATYQLTYTAKIITNGIYLTEENVQMLIDNKVGTIQVTIDGAREVHDRKRPLKQKLAENYFRIIRNLSKIPEGIFVTIRLNVDKEVAASIDTLLDDLYEYGIWPQKYKQVNLYPAWLRSYEELEIAEEEQEKRLFADEYFEFKQNLRLNQLRRFNTWADQNNIRKAKLKWDLPVYQSTCPTWASPISLVVDPNGNIHKCWETIHDESVAPSSVFQDYNPAHFAPYTAFNRYTHNDVCRNCKFLPVCDKISCSHEAINNVTPQCSEWKYKLESYLKYQYVVMQEDPAIITAPETKEAVNTGHSNK